MRISETDTLYAAPDDRHKKKWPHTIDNLKTIKDMETSPKLSIKENEENSCWSHNISPRGTGKLRYAEKDDTRKGRVGNYHIKELDYREFLLVSKSISSFTDVFTQGYYFLLGKRMVIFKNTFLSINYRSSFRFPILIKIKHQPFLISHRAVSSKLRIIIIFNKSIITNSFFNVTKNHFKAVAGGC